MPEGPEVETIRRDLAPAVEGRTFQQVILHWSGTVREPFPEGFVQALTGQRIHRLSRRGKYLLFHLASGGALIVHLGMTGRLYIPQRGQPPDPYCRASFHLEGDVELHFADVRKFGHLRLVADAAAALSKLGPEALAMPLTPGELKERLGRRSARIKSLLLDQSFLAGLGNIYADESLFLARIHPLRRANTLSEDEVRELHQAIETVLQRGLANRGTSFDDYRDGYGRKGENQESLNIFRRTGAPCPRCGEAVQRMVVGGRGTHFCPRCQGAVRPYEYLSSLQGSPLLW